MEMNLIADTADRIAKPVVRDTHRLPDDNAGSVVSAVGVVVSCREPVSETSTNFAEAAPLRNHTEFPLDRPPIRRGASKNV